MVPTFALIAAYLIGSIPFGYLIVRASSGGDVRQTGSGGTGATNVSRRAGKPAGVLTLLLDAAKGAAVVALARWLVPEPTNDWWVAAAGILVIVGHIFPIWLAFRGGKGVATGIGVFLMFSPATVLAAAILFFVIAWLTRYVSLASVSAAAAIPLFVWLESGLRGRANFVPMMSVAVMSALLIIIAHRGNINRLLNGTEPRFQ